MEKIIAVVVMIAIVVGLIATAVLPMVNQMNAQGDNANSQLESLTMGTSSNSAMGASVLADLRMYRAQIVDGQENTDHISFTIDRTRAGGDTIVADAAGNYETALEKAQAQVDPQEAYSKTVVKYPSGKIREITYTLK